MSVCGVCVCAVCVRAWSPFKRLPKTKVQTVKPFELKIIFSNFSIKPCVLDAPK